MNRLKIDFSHRQVMAVINVTPDSFYASSRTAGRAEVIARVRRALDEGASIIDIGGYSSRPGADEVPADEEFRRVAEGLRAVRDAAPDAVVSVDTFRADVAARCIEAFGPIVVNDISAGAVDSDMWRVVARYDVPYVAMHMRGTPATMQSMTDYGDVAGEVADWLGRRIDAMVAAGIGRSNIIVDPGFGFAKSAGQNFALLAGLHRICRLGYPVLAGVSRKSMIYRTLGTTPDHALNGTTALHWECLRQGASILRVHDVREAAETIRLYEEFEKQNDK